MRLHRMTFRGLGPFRDEQHVDFRDLASSGLFLLEGPTGSGKSTLIDALVFALYGGVAADAGHKDRLVSHYLPAGDEPFVELVFETSSGVYRVRRTPEHERPKKRGEGMVTAHAGVTLTRLGSPDSQDGEVLSTRVGEADAEIRHAIGLNRDQFIGTVVLPQGEFASFLRAKVGDRAEILQRIFRTDLYKRLQVALDEARKKALADRRAADAAVDVAVGEFVGAAGLAGQLPGWDGDLSSAEQLEAALRQVLLDLGAAQAECVVREQQAREDADVARAQRDERAGRVQRRDRRRRADHEREQLDAAEPGVSADTQRVAAAERASRVTDQLAAERQAAGRADKAAAAVTRARGAVDAADRELEEPALRELREATDVQVGQLADLVALEGGLKQRSGEIDRLRTQHGTVSTSLAGVRDRLEAIPTERAALGVKREEHHAVAGRSEQLAADVEGLLGRHGKALELERARAEVVKAQHAVDRAAAASKQALDELARVRTGYLAGISTVLAAELRDGDRCPVCGSVEHPQPATPGEGHVTVEQVDAADAAHAKADRALRQREQALGKSQVAVASLEGVVAGRTAGELADELAAAREALAAAQQAARRVVELDRSLGILEEEATAKGAELTRLTEQVAALATQVEAKQAALAEDTVRVESAREGRPTVRARVDQLKAASKSLGALLDALSEQVAAASEHGRHRAALALALEREGFAHASDAESAALPARALADLRAGIERHRNRRLLNSNELADPDVAGVDPAEEIDLTAAEEALREATGRLDEAAKALGVAQTRLKDSDRNALSVRAGLEQRSGLIARTEPLIRVARLAVGDAGNRLLMDLATYVLQQRFESVVAAANDHLRLMSDGKLVLIAHDEAEGRARKAGLGLRVVDLRTDKERPTGTLSGGETFYTALSLALGLAGVVTAEAGGVSLETLFVDEGFGSLDPDTLDDVMSVLTSLREGGRTVGVVSHVDEMKNRIPERITVRRDDDRGPSRLVVVG